MRVCFFDKIIEIINEMMKDCSYLYKIMHLDTNCLIYCIKLIRKKVLYGQFAKHFKIILSVIQLLQIVLKRKAKVKKKIIVNEKNNTIIIVVIVIQ